MISWRALTILGLVLGLVLSRDSEQDVDEIISSGKIKVVGSSDDSSNDERFQKFCFTIDIEDKNKRHAYEHSIQKLSKIQRYFKIKELIPNEASLTVRKVEARLNRKRRGKYLTYVVWTVLKTVCFLSEQDEQRFIEKSLRALGVHQFRAYPIGSLLD